MESYNLELLSKVQERQKAILKKLPKYFITTIVIAVLGIIFTSITESANPISSSRLFKLSSASLVDIITLILNLFSILMLWLFVIWAISFIPFIAIQAHKSSEKIKFELETKSFRWIQLYSSSFIPMIIFSFAWLSLPKYTYIEVPLSSPLELIKMVLVGIFIWGLLYLVTSVVKKQTALNVAFISTLLFISLYIAFGVGYGGIAYSTLFGILFYLATNFELLEELGKRIAMFDIDPVIVDKVISTGVTHQEIKASEDELALRGLELGLKKKKSSQKQNEKKLDHEIELSDEYDKIKQTEIDFNKNFNQTMLNVFLQKSTTLNQMFQILSKELDSRIVTQIPEKIEELKKNAKNYNPKQLFTEMMSIYSQMSKTLTEIPETLNDIRDEMTKVLDDMKKQTQSLLDKNNEGN